jgi:uracil-DNA glycosylase
MATSLKLLQTHVAALRKCEACPDMQRPVVTGVPVLSPVMLLGQAPGTHEGKLDRPFAWTAGKTMFGWFSGLGVSEEQFRSRVYMAAVCRCFPGKGKGGGDRVPSPVEIAACSRWLSREAALVRPQLLIPVGKLAIAQVMEVDKLADIVGKTYRVSLHGYELDAVPLPHPSGASTWHRVEPGKSLLAQALAEIERHPAWQHIARPTARPRKRLA